MNELDTAYQSGYRRGESVGYKRGFADCAEIEMRHRMRLEKQVEELIKLHGKISNPPPILACADCPKIKLPIVREVE